MKFWNQSQLLLGSLIERPMKLSKIGQPLPTDGGREPGARADELRDASNHIPSLRAGKTEATDNSFAE